MELPLPRSSHYVSIAQPCSRVPEKTWSCRVWSICKFLIFSIPFSPAALSKALPFSKSSVIFPLSELLWHWGFYVLCGTSDTNFVFCLVFSWCFPLSPSGTLWLCFPNTKLKALHARATYILTGGLDTPGADTLLLSCDLSWKSFILFTENMPKFLVQPGYIHPACHSMRKFPRKWAWPSVCISFHDVRATVSPPRSTLADGFWSLGICLTHPGYLVRFIAAPFQMMSPSVLFW